MCDKITSVLLFLCKHMSYKFCIYQATSIPPDLFEISEDKAPEKIKFQVASWRQVADPAKRRQKKLSRKPFHLAKADYLLSGCFT